MVKTDKGKLPAKPFPTVDQTIVLRSDVRRNRLAILQAARELFATGADVPMYEIGRRAGVGQATLYRHFPDRGDLAAAVAEEMLQELERDAAELGPGPETFTLLLRRVVDIVARSRGLVAVIRETRSEAPQLNQAARRLLALFATPLRQAQAAGLVNKKFRLDDVMLVINMIHGALETTTEEQNNRTATAQKALEMITRGITPLDLSQRQPEGPLLGHIDETTGPRGTVRATVPKPAGTERRPSRRR